MPNHRVCGKSGSPAKNRENNKAFFEFDLEFIEFCPKSANLASGQGNNREFCGFLRKQISTKHLVLFCAGFKKITGNYQGARPAMMTFSLPSEAAVKYFTMYKRAAPGRPFLPA